MADVLSILAQPTRKAILSHLWSGELGVGEIHKRLDTVTMGAVSQHLKVMLEAGVVDVRKERQQRLYRVRREGLGELASYFDSMWGNALDRLVAVAESEEAKRSVSQAGIEEVGDEASREST